jgi:endonuclease III related protein
LAISQSETIVDYYVAMLRRWGPQNWWPAQSRFEVIVGAYLTQNTNWLNVEKALMNLRKAGSLSPEALRAMPLERLQELIRPSGYYRQKAIKLKIFMEYFDGKYAGSLDRMFAQPTAQLRDELLALHGVGPETADSILLYAGNHPAFVVDAYTRRILERHGLIAPATSYEEIRAMMERAVKSAAPDELAVPMVTHEPRHAPSRMSRMSRSELAQHYNELHALIVRVGNQLCRNVPLCLSCPLQPFLTSTIKQQTSKPENRSK